MFVSKAWEKPNSDKVHLNILTKIKLEWKFLESKTLKRHYNNTHKEFNYNDFTYDGFYFPMS